MKTRSSAPPHVIEAIKRDAGKGVSGLPSDQIPWTNVPEADYGYLNLICEIDQDKDPSRLLPLLNVPETVRPYFEDLFDRLEFRKRRGKGRSIPKYTLSDENIRYYLAMNQVRRRNSHVRKGPKVSRAAAIATAAENYQLDPKSLDRALREGGYSSLRHALKRGGVKWDYGA
jgi:hypothetical protein